MNYYSQSVRIFSFTVILFSVVSFSSFAGDGESKSALVVIDMQDYFATRRGYQEDPKNIAKLKAVLKAQTNAISVAKVKGIPIVFVEYKSRLFSDYGETNPQLRRAASGYESTMVFKKSTDGMFDDKKSTVLKQFFQKNDVDTLIVCGANGGACVKSSIRGALIEGYNVIAYNKAIADFNYESFVHPYRNFGWVQANNGQTFNEARSLDEIFPNTSAEEQDVKVSCVKVRS
jgi:nicotinamidase-related amidase